MSEPLALPLSPPLPLLNDPQARLVWALKTLDVFSQPKNRDALGANNLRVAARKLLLQVLSAHPELKHDQLLQKHQPLWQKHGQERQRHADQVRPLQQLDPKSLLHVLLAR